jgi:cephalosporin-C deacetylase
VAAPLYDLPLADLRSYRSTATAPDDLDDFWRSAIAAARDSAFEPRLEPYRADVYRALDATDVTFAGADGDPVRAWYLRPAGSGSAPLPCRVAFVGYGGGRDLPAAHALYPACGYATFVMDTRAQGGTWSAGDTPDPGAGDSSSEHPGVMTRGIASPETYYYRRLYVDAVRAVETAIDPPYTELVTYLGIQRDREPAVWRTLSYFDNAVLAPRITARTAIGVGLRDAITPPSTVFAAYNAIQAEKEIVVFPYSGHQLPTRHTEWQLADFARLAA